MFLMFCIFTFVDKKNHWIFSSLHNFTHPKEGVRESHQWKTNRVVLTVVWFTDILTVETI